MDKNFILNILNKTIKSEPLDIQNINALFIEYCCSEHNKDVNMTMKFVNILLSVDMIEEYLVEVLNYYKIKYNIIELKNINNNTILYF